MTHKKSAWRRLSWFVAVVYVVLSVSACNGPSCDSCSDDSDCSGSESCYHFSDGKNRCADKKGDTC